MTIAKKTGLIIILIGICLPTATLPFIKEFHPVPQLCLTSNFFNNMGSMIVAFGMSHAGMQGSESLRSLIAVPYRYLFSLGVILVCAGLGILVVTAGDCSGKKR